MRSFSTADLNKQVGEITNAAGKEPVFITRHRKPRYVLMSIDHYHELTGQPDPRRAFTLETMPADIEAGLLAAADAYQREHGGE
ncbi:type II toxin-antitoxin system Phd/YefM family antitoxin [Fulvimarina endophytica]|uniref:Antitoxin n=1 Tax=Fulvimarina endophytica TaxID=2293836 RepID=A0A371WXX4_9HYPH|nr:type II toxin-antitoxin system Phd/YefM family antitoxin [Fulvimarina endophytica]RFC61828.1 type II toxin-antitoxin system Phd/YefM family antitoxin [Fulvimarina endophytica]